MRRFYLAVALMLLSILGPIAGAVAKEPANVINIYSSRHYDVDQKLYKMFEEKTGIKVQHTESEGPGLLEKLIQEGDKTPADLLIAVDIGNIWRAKAAGVLQSVESPVLQKAVPAPLRDTENQWFALSKRSRVIFYNKQKIKDGEITRYEDLADPKWKGKILLRPSSNVYNQSLVASMIVADGEPAAEQWAKGLIGNLAAPPSGNDVELIKDIAKGKADITIANTYYFARMLTSPKKETRDAAAKVAWVFPNQNDRGAHINISGIALTKGARHKDNAIKFMEFLVSPEAQEIFADGNNEYPVLAGVAENSTVKSLGGFKGDSMNLSDIGKANAAAVKLMDRTGWK